MKPITLDYPFDTSHVLNRIRSPWSSTVGPYWFGILSRFDSVCLSPYQFLFENIIRNEISSRLQ